MDTMNPLPLAALKVLMQHAPTLRAQVLAFCVRLGVGFRVLLAASGENATHVARFDHETDARQHGRAFGYPRHCGAAPPAVAAAAAAAAVPGEEETEAAEGEECMRVGRGCEAREKHAPRTKQRQAKGTAMPDGNA